MFPSWGEANFLPAKSFGDSIPESLLTTKTAPPLVAPEIILISFPPDIMYALIAGLGPMYVASI